MSKVLYSFPVFKTLYGTAYIMAEDRERAYKTWQDYDDNSESCYLFEDCTSEISSKCNLQGCEVEFSCPEGVTPIGCTPEEYRDYLIEQYNKKINELNSIRNAIEKANAKDE